MRDPRWLRSHLHLAHLIPPSPDLSTWQSHFLRPGVAALAAILTAGTVEAVMPRPGMSAEEIRLYVDGPIVLAVPIEALETFAATGETTGRLSLLARFVDDSAMGFLQQGLQRQFTTGVVQVDHLTYSPLGRDFLEQLGKVIRIDPQVNGATGLRAALINAAAHADESGWTALDVLREFPSQSIDVDVKQLLALRQEALDYIDYSQAVVQAIETESASQAAAELVKTDDLAALADLSQPGPYPFGAETITVSNPALRQTARGLSVNYDFSVDIYAPQGLNEPAPIVIVSHGFGAVKENFVSVAEHLASHGFVVMVPDHVGSDLAYRQSYLQGRLNTLLSPVEFLNRPQEISFLIDELEQLVTSDPHWAGLLNLDQIGVMGDSLGATTVLSLAGAEINYARLMDTCQAETVQLNVALYLQCRAQYLPPEDFQLGDPRIKAAIAAHPLSSGIFGPEGISQIEIPILLTAGSRDIVAPMMTEQIHPFVWMSATEKYLALFDPATHFITSEQSPQGAEMIPRWLIGEHQEFGRAYYGVLSIAFFKTYLRNQPEFASYLSSAYAQFMSDGNPLALAMLRSLTPEQLTAAHGGTPPFPIIPPAIRPVAMARNEPILDQIRETGTLRVALRRDAAPLGYINSDDQWTGYCQDLAIALRDEISGQFGFGITVELAELPSTLDDRFELVQNGYVDFECGPNTIREDIDGVVFSNPFLGTGTRLLVQATDQDTINPNLSLEGVRIGLLSNTTTERFFQTTYPKAEFVYFDPPAGSVDALAALNSRQIDAFANDSVLLVAEALQQNLPLEQYTLVPDLPLTCDFYGLILPNDDPDWRRFVNRFLTRDTARQIQNDWFASVASYELNELSYCLNR
ncbi:MAG: alpha/beta hydrolase [Thainema sp.]